VTHTGTVRRVDDLGRIVIPAEMRRILGIKAKDPLEISMQDGRIIINQYIGGCALCGATDKPTHTFRGKKICIDCTDGVKKL